MNIISAFRNRRRYRDSADRGIVMCATGNNNLFEAAEAARAAKSHMKLDVDITTNSYGSEFLETLENSPFDNIYVVNEMFGYTINDISNRFLKMHCMLNSRFIRTLFIDTDAFIIQPVDDIFNALEYWDIAICHAPWRIGSLHQKYKDSISTSMKSIFDIENLTRFVFPEFNGGLIGFSKSYKAINFVKKWQYFYKDQFSYYNNNKNEEPNYSDQATLRRALLSTRPNICVLPPEYNIRVVFPYFIGGNSQARVLHGRGPAFDMAYNSVNASLDVRIGMPTGGIIGN